MPVILPFILPFLKDWRVWAAIGLVSGVLWLRWDAVHQDRIQRDKEVAEARLKQAKIAADATSEINANRKESELQLGLALATTKTRVEYLEKEVNRYVPQDVVDKYPLSTGWVLWHNLAATPGNFPKDSFSESTMVGEKSTIRSDEALRTIGRNYKRYYEVDALLTSCAAEYKSVYDVVEQLKSKVK